MTLYFYDFLKVLSGYMNNAGNLKALNCSWEGVLETHVVPFDIISIQNELKSKIIILVMILPKELALRHESAVNEIMWAGATIEPIRNRRSSQLISLTSYTWSDYIRLSTRTRNGFELICNAFRQISRVWARILTEYIK